MMSQLMFNCKFCFSQEIMTAEMQLKAFSRDINKLLLIKKILRQFELCGHAKSNFF